MKQYEFLVHAPVTDLTANHLPEISFRQLRPNEAPWRAPPADIHEIDVTHSTSPTTNSIISDPEASAKIRITGAAAPIANAIYNATGNHVRDLHLPLDKIMQA